MADEQKVEGLLVVDADISKVDQKLTQAEKRAEQHKKKQEKTAKEAAASWSAADRVRIEQEKRLTQVSAALARERVQIARNEGKELDKVFVGVREREKRLTSSRRSGQTINEIRERGQQQRTTVLARGSSVLTQQEARRRSQLDVEESRRTTRELDAENKKQIEDLKQTNRQKLEADRNYNMAVRQLRGARLRDEGRERVERRRKEIADQKAAAFASGQSNPFYALGWDAKLSRTSASSLLFGGINQGLGQYNNRMQIQNAAMAAAPGSNVGSSVWQMQMNQAIARSNAVGAAFFAAQQPPPGPPPRRGGGLFGAGGPLRPGGVLSRMAGGVASGLGIGVGGFGAYAAVQAGRSLVESTQLATAYERQRVAAESLAGSQAQLNALLDAYAKASGGAVDQVTSLGNVTRLLATGFARTVPEAERFVKATRGASIALGRPQEEITQETQLAISNTSVKRLDQIGLGIEEVNVRIEQLRKTNSNWTREMAFHDAVLSVMEEKYGHLTDTVAGQATEVEKLAKTWSDLRLEVGKNSKESIEVASSALSIALNVGAEKIRQEFKELDFYIKALRLLGNPIVSGGSSALIRQLTPTWLTSDEREFAQSAGSMAGGERGYLSNRGLVPPASTGYSEEIMAGMNALRQAETDIAEKWQTDRLAATEQYEEQRTTIIRNYERQIAQEAEDFAIRRARSNRDFNKSISDAIEDAAKRDADLTEDYHEAVAEAREDSEKRIAEMEKEYQKEREKDVADHRDRLLKAAGQLDAIAVLEERKRWRREGKEREEGHKEQISKARDALAEQLDDARKAYEERLEEARAADQERLNDMREVRAQQLADEDADRALQLQRSQEDHDEQLSELDRQHGLRMKQIEEQARKEREQWQKEFEDFAIENNLYIAGLQEKRKKIDDLTEEWFDKLIERLEKEIKYEAKMRSLTPEEMMQVVPGGATMESFARGGRVGRTGPAILHAGEVVLSRGMLSGTQPAPAGVANAISHKSVVFQPGAIALYPAPGWDADDMLEDLEVKLIEILDRT